MRGKRLGLEAVERVRGSERGGGGGLVEEVERKVFFFVSLLGLFSGSVAQGLGAKASLVLRAVRSLIGRNGADPGWEGFGRART